MYSVGLATAELELVALFFRQDAQDKQDPGLCGGKALAPAIPGDKQPDRNRQQTQDHQPGPVVGCGNAGLCRIGPGGEDAYRVAGTDGGVGLVGVVGAGVGGYSLTVTFPNLEAFLGSD